MDPLKIHQNHTSGSNNNMDNIDIENILTEEEKNQLDIIQKKIQSNLNKLYKKNIENFSKNNQIDEPLNLDEASHPKHITTNQREILISIRAEISTIDEKGHLKDIQQCLDNYYHIPVAADTDYQKLLDEFVNKFDSELTSCARKIHPENVQPE